jgi:hypothetical protein
MGCAHKLLNIYRASSNKQRVFLWVNKENAVHSRFHIHLSALSSV